MVTVINQTNKWVSSLMTHQTQYRWSQRSQTNKKTMWKISCREFFKETYQWGKIITQVIFESSYTTADMTGHIICNSWGNSGYLCTNAQPVIYVKKSLLNSADQSVISPLLVYESCAAKLRNCPTTLQDIILVLTTLPLWFCHRNNQVARFR